jgi:DNA invertase Pin-like site-specific DNA recombinase
VRSLAISYIRFSTKSQGAEGRDSLRRQIERTAAYCAEHELELDESLRDLGKSAYKSRHLLGALGGFLERLSPTHPNRIPADSVLIVEAMDRLSRATPREALGVFLAIIDAGVMIVTLTDGQRYDKASIDANMGQLFLSIGLMFGAHQESKNRAIRIKASWTARRTRPTKMAPAWITIIDGKYVVRPECVPVIRYIFEQSRDGVGSDRIVANLNARGVQTFSGRKRLSSTGWYEAYVRKMLQGRAVLGWLQEHELRDDIRTPISEWKQVYPEAIDPVLWQQANDALVSRRPTPGRKGNKFSNLLAGLAECECGAPMRLRIQSNRSSYTYYRCRDAVRGLACERTGYINYRPVEALILKYFGASAYGLDEPTDDQSVGILVRIAAKRTESASMETAINRILAAVEGGAGAIAARRLNALEASHAKAVADLAAMERELGAVSRRKPRTEDLETLKRLIAGLGGLEADAMYQARARINAGLKRLLDAVMVTGETVTLRLTRSFSQRWEVSTGGNVKEFVFHTLDTSKVQALVE